MPMQFVLEARDDKTAYVTCRRDGVEGTHGYDSLADAFSAIHREVYPPRPFTGWDLALALICISAVVGVIALAMAKNWGV